MVQRTTAARPVLHIPRTTAEVCIEVAGLLGLAVAAYLVATNFAALPETIPIHFSLDGRPDGWGGRATVIIAPIVMLVVYIGLGVLWRYPHIFNYPWPITAENAPAQYRLSRRVIAVLKVLIAWLGAYIVYTQIQGARGVPQPLSPWFLPVFLVAVFGTIGGHLALARRRK